MDLSVSLADRLVSYQSKKTKKLVSEGNEQMDEEVYDSSGEVGEELLISDEPLINVMRCLNASPIAGDWRRTSIFQTFTKIGDKLLRVIIDGGSSLNVISKTALTTLSLIQIRTAWVGSIKPTCL